MRELLDNAAFLALLGTIFGSVGLKLVESWVGRAKERATEQAGMRSELRQEIEGLRSELKAAADEENRLEEQLDKWKNDFYTLKEDNVKMIARLSELTSELKTLQSRLENRDNL